MKLISALLMLIVLILQACSPSIVNSQRSDASAGYPLDTKTGIPEVDNVLTVVSGRNSEKLHALIRYTVAPCTTADGFGGPPKCRQGERDGTLLEVLPIIGSEGSYIRKDEIDSLKGINVDGIYAIYRTSEDALNEQYYPPGDYIILFMPSENESVVALHIADGGIVRVDNLFGEFPDSQKIVIQRDTAEVILAPRKR